MPHCLLDVDSRNGSCCPLDSLATLLGTPCYQFGSLLLFELSQFTQIQPGAASISQRFCFLLSCEQHSRSMVQISHYTTRLRWLYRRLRVHMCQNIPPTPLLAWTLDKQRVNVILLSCQLEEVCSFFFDLFCHGDANHCLFSLQIILCKL